MVVMTMSGAMQAKAAVLPAVYLEEHWYAVQTCANHEKRVLQQLANEPSNLICPCMCPCVDGRIGGSAWSCRFSRVTFLCVWH